MKAQQNKPLKPVHVCVHVSVYEREKERDSAVLE